MAKIIHFIPKAEATAHANVESFISFCKPLLDAYPDIPSWEEDRWSPRGISEEVGRKPHAIVFSSFEMAAKKGNSMLSQPFLDFAKAYFLYNQSLRPTLVHNYRMSALRALEKALRASTGDSTIERLNPAICNMAINFLEVSCNKNSAYKIGLEITSIVKMLNKNRMVMAPFQWKSHLAPFTVSNRVGKEADAARRAKLPSETALDALPKCYNMASEPQDIIISSIAALLLTAPDRISEVFRLSVNCEIEKEHKGKKIYGFRWYPSKGSEPMVKWIPSQMVDLAKDALGRIKKITEPARKLALWYEQNPGKIFLLPEYEHFRSKKFLTLAEVALITGFSHRTVVYNWAETKKIKIHQPDNDNEFQKLKFSDVELEFLKLLPDGFPILDRRTGLKYSEALLVCRMGELNEDNIKPGMIQTIGESQIRRGLGGDVNFGKSSLFSRLGFSNPDGTAIKISTHQFRHWLNTLAHRGGMSQLDIAKWSGRMNVNQNQAYDHMTSDEIISMTMELVNTGSTLFGPLDELVDKTPISRDEFFKLEFPTAHVTEIGYCVHDYTMLPCQKFGDCINCRESMCIKGDAKKTERIRKILADAEELLRRAELAKQEGYYGSDRWFEHHQAVVERYRHLLSALEDPTIPIGTPIFLSNVDEHSPISTAMRKHLQQNPPGELEPPSLLPTLSGGN
jgi:hypothetical protein